MKYSGGVISGKASKTGTYTVKFTSKNAAGTRTKTIKIVVVNPGFDVSVNVRANGATATYGAPTTRATPGSEASPRSSTSNIRSALQASVPYSSTGSAFQA